MSTKLALAAAALVAVLTGPALANRHPPAAQRIVRDVPANAFASTVTTQMPASDRYQNDFQLQGRF